jgi:hypothetical protein
MKMPDKPVTLTVEQVDQLNRKLSKMRHDINNNLAILTAAMELIRLRPADLNTRLDMMSEQPNKIAQTINSFSAEFDQVLGISRT